MSTFKKGFGLQVLGLKDKAQVGKGRGMERKSVRDRSRIRDPGAVSMDKVERGDAGDSGMRCEQLPCEPTPSHTYKTKFSSPRRYSYVVRSGNQDHHHFLGNANPIPRCLMDIDLY